MKDSFERLTLERDASVATVTLNRPEIHNAFDPIMIQELTEVFESLSQEADVRAVVLTGSGKSFCAGADLSWMKSLAEASHEENKADAHRLEKMMRVIGQFPKALVIFVNGAAIGGGCGLACAGDIVLATPEARFGLSEVRLGILPAVIAPYVLRRIGFSASSRYMLTGERFSSEEARDIGLVNEIVSLEESSEHLKKIISHLLKGGVEAQSATKKLMRDIQATLDSQKIAELTAEAIANRRVSAEGQEGMQAFFEKRSPSWSVS